jgi:hypothetical protein
VYENCTEVVLLLVASELESGPLLGITTLYGLDGTGIESRCEYFPHPSIPALAPAQPLGGLLSGGGWLNGRGMALIIQSTSKVKERVEL